MDNLQNAAVLELRAYQSRFSKKTPVYVPPRPFHSLTLRLKGSVRLDSTVSGPGQVTYMPRGMGYETQVLENGSMIVVHFSMTEEADGGHITVHTPRQPARMRALFEALLAHSRPGQPRAPAAMGHMYALLDLLATERTPVPDDAMARARQLLEQGYSDAQLSVEALAQQLGLSPAYLRRRFRAAFGCAPHRYLHRLRLENACALLQTGLLSVGEVALRCGYQSLSYFSASFREDMGISPTEYMQKGLPFDKKEGIL